MTEMKNTLLGADFMKMEEEKTAQRKEIRERFSNITFPDPVLEPIYFGRTIKTQVKNKRLIRDAGTGAQYAVVSDKYHKVHHEDVLRNLISAIPDEFGEPVFDINLINDGALLNAEVTFPEIASNINGSDQHLMVRVGNSYDTSRMLNWDWGAKELVCSNGLIAFVKKDSSRARHLQGPITQMELQTRLTKVLDSYSEQNDIWLEWSKRQLNELEFGSIFEELPFSEKERDELMEIPIMNHDNTPLSKVEKPTVWTINSAATQFAKHNITSEKRSFELEGKIAKSIATNWKKLS